jgi:hypothetical protein
MPEVATKPLPEPLERMKRLIEYLPEVKMGKALIRWVRSQPPPDPAPAASVAEPRPPQSR